MRIRWTPAAVADLQGISDSLKERHPRYRDATVRKLYGTIGELRQWPGRGRPGVKAELGFMTLRAGETPVTGYAELRRRMPTR